jgi:hypothetical protein
MHPNDTTYFIDRRDFAGGDNGFAVPIGKCAEGTVCASFSAHPIEPVPVSQMTAVNTGTGPRAVWSFKDPWHTWPGGHHPMLVCYAIDLPTIPLYRGTTTLIDYFGQVVINAQLEGHEEPVYTEDGMHFPVLTWETLNFQPFLIHYQRKVSDETVPHDGDSSVPRFVQDIDGNLAFLGQEVWLNGGGSSSEVYVWMLEQCRANGRDVTWEEMDLWDLQRGWLNYRKPIAPPVPILTPADRPADVPRSIRPTTTPTPVPPPTPVPVGCRWNEGAGEGEDKLYDGLDGTKGLTFGNMETRGVKLIADPSSKESKGPIVQLAGLEITDTELVLMVANDTHRNTWRNPLWVEYNGKIWQNDGWPTNWGAKIRLPLEAAEPEPPANDYPVSIALTFENGETKTYLP